VLQAISAGLFIILLGLGAAGFGLSLMLRANRSHTPAPGAPPRSPLSPLATRLRGSAFLAIGLSMVGYGVTVPRYTYGGHTTLPSNAPLLDQVIWLLTLVCLVSFVALVAALGWVSYAQNRRARRKDAGDARR
jgi:hypothetical protein